MIERGFGSVKSGYRPPMIWISIRIKSYWFGTKNSGDNSIIIAMCSKKKTTYSHKAPICRRCAYKVYVSNSCRFRLNELFFRSVQMKSMPSLSQTARMKPGDGSLDKTGLVKRCPLPRDHHLRANSSQDVQLNWFDGTSVKFLNKRLIPVNWNPEISTKRCQMKVFSKKNLWL
jgi:hypothetical protein